MKFWLISIQYKNKKRIVRRLYARNAASACRLLNDILTTYERLNIESVLVRETVETAVDWEVPA